MRVLEIVDLTKEGEKKYTTYFYHKMEKYVFKVISNGTRCAPYLAEKIGISKKMKFSSCLPKYISNDIL